jgi:hypothetical protein
MSHVLTLARERNNPFLEGTETLESKKKSQEKNKSTGPERNEREFG